MREKKKNIFLTQERRENANKEAYMCDRQIKVDR